MNYKTLPIYLISSKSKNLREILCIIEEKKKKKKLHI